MLNHAFLIRKSRHGVIASLMRKKNWTIEPRGNRVSRIKVAPVRYMRAADGKVPAGGRFRPQSSRNPRNALTRLCAALESCLE